MSDIPTEKLLPQGLQDMLSAHRKYTAQANDINNEIIDKEMKSPIPWTTGAPTKPGRYIVTVRSPYGSLYTSIDIFDGLRWEYYNNNSIVAFCSTFHIQPYKPKQ